MREEMWRFEIGAVLVTAVIEPDYDFDLSWDETGEVADKLNSGEWSAFSTTVTVYLDGVEMGSDHLGGSVYSDPEDFFTGHRDPDPENRNCTLRKRFGIVGHYFPEMVRVALDEARRNAGKVARFAS